MRLDQRGGFVGRRGDGVGLLRFIQLQPRRGDGFGNFDTPHRSALGFVALLLQLFLRGIQFRLDGREHLFPLGQ